MNIAIADFVGRLRRARPPRWGRHGRRGQVGTWCGPGVRHAAEYAVVVRREISSTVIRGTPRCEIGEGDGPTEGEGAGAFANLGNDALRA